MYISYVKYEADRQNDTLSGNFIPILVNKAKKKGSSIDPWALWRPFVYRGVRIRGLRWGMKL